MKSPTTPPRKANSRPPDIIAIQEALKGPVVDVLVDCVPQLAQVPRDQVYDTIMNSPRLADACFKLFRSQRGRFDAVVRRPDGSPVKDDNDVMTCGRTLAEAVTLIVRAAAKRYFLSFDTRQTKDKPAPPPPKPPRASLWNDVQIRLGLKEPPRRAVTPRPSRAEELFRAFREFLLYEWQVPLIPYYAPLPVAVVAAAGPLILQLREPSQIEALGQMRPGWPPCPCPGAAAAEKERAGESART